MKRKVAHQVGIRSGHDSRGVLAHESAEVIMLSNLWKISAKENDTGGQILPNMLFRSEVLR